MRKGDIGLNPKGHKENIMMAAVMSVVSCLVLISASIAWFTGSLGIATVHPGRLKADGEKQIKVATTAGGEDIASLTGEAALIKIGLEELTNIKPGQIAPGAYGQVNFYITPLSEDVTGYEVIPSLALATGDNIDDMTQEELDAFMEMFRNHIVMFADDAYRNEITEEAPAMGILEWDAAENKGIEKEVTLYWKWYYTYPFTAEENGNLTEAQKLVKTAEYDKEDTEIGNNINTIQFWFKFQATQ